MTSGDLLPMLGISESKSSCPTLSPIGKKNSDFYEYLKNEGRAGVHTKGTNENLPRALIFRDSFFSMLEPFTSPLFSESEYIWRNFRDSEKETILKYKPDILIFEIVERNGTLFLQCSSE